MAGTVVPELGMLWESEKSLESQTSAPLYQKHYLIQRGVLNQIYNFDLEELPLPGSVSSVPGICCGPGFRGRVENSPFLPPCQIYNPPQVFAAFVVWRFRPHGLSPPCV